MSRRSVISLVAFLVTIFTGAVASDPSGDSRILKSRHHPGAGLGVTTEDLIPSDGDSSSLRGSTTVTDTDSDALVVVPPTETAVTITSSLRTIPHDRDAFTEGYQLHDGYLYESVGLRGKSSIRKIDVVTGETVMEKSDHMGSSLFAEGLMVFEDKVIQLTYKAKTAFVMDVNTFDLLDTFQYEVETGEGWGFTHNGEHLIVSDGSHHIYFWDPETFEEVRRISVTDRLSHSSARNVKKLNELEFVLGEILANIWYDTKIARINPETGDIIGYIHLDQLHAIDHLIREDCWNGIAYDAEAQELILAGKKFKDTYVIQWPPTEE